MESPEKLKLLFLPAWYPNRKDPMQGLFVQKHAEAVSSFAEVTVLAVVSEERKGEIFEVETKMDKGFTEIIIYTRKFKSPVSLLNSLVNGIRYITAHIAGWKILEQTGFRPDLNHVHILTRAGLMALFFKIRYGIPYVITEHWSRYLPHHNGYHGVLRHALTRKVVDKSEGVSTVSKALKEGMNARDLQHPNWHIIPNVVDTRLFMPDGRTNSHPVIRFSHISCFEEKSKNMSGILRAARKLKDQGIAFELLMIGDGPDKKATEKLATKLGLADQVVFTGVLEGVELVEAMSTCSFSVLFSHYETFAIVIPENLSLGIPVIATGVGGIPEVLPEKYGILIPPRDEEALAKAMIHMIENHDHYDKDEMRNYVEENYSYEEVGKRFLEFYQSAFSP